MISIDRPSSSNARSAIREVDPWKIPVLFYIFIIVLAVSGYFNPAFFKAANLSNLLTQTAPLAIVVLGQMTVLLVRGIDLSVASTMATSAVIATAFHSSENSMIPAIFVVCIGFGVLVGLVNGYLVVIRRVSPFLATLATMIVLQGVRFAYTGGSNSGTLPPGFREIGRGQLLGIPYNGIALLCLTILLGVLLARSTFGRRVHLIGNNPEGAALAGINVTAVTMACYVICSTLAASAGLMLVGYVGLVDNWTGRGYELDSIVAAVMGGVAISGGRGSVGGALLGAAVLTTTFNLVVLLGLPAEVQHIIKGIVIIAAAAAYSGAQMKAALFSRRRANGKAMT